jgi:hypothetical protein
MLGELGGRDRLVMAGLVVLGLMTVVAGVVSGRSTAEYVLGEDAREAGLGWAKAIDAALAEGKPQPILDGDLEVLDAAKLRGQFPSAATPSAAAPDTQAGAAAVNEHVSRLDGAALLGADRTPLAVAGALTPSALKQ